MIKSGFKIYGTAVFMALVSPLWANHGSLLSTDRDPGLNTDLNNLIAAGWIDNPDKDTGKMTNLEVAQLTAQAGNSVPLPEAPLDSGLPPMMNDPGLPSASSPGLPQPTLNGIPSYSGSPGLPYPAQPLPNNMLMPGYSVPPAALVASKSLKQLVSEYKSELAAMGINTAQIEDRIYVLEHNDWTLADLQKLYLQRTGTDVTGFSRGYLNEYRGFGTAPGYGPYVFNDAVFGEMDLKSVPVPSVLFDARIRLWRTIGLYNQDPIEKNGGTLFDVRWLSLSNYNPYVNVTAGDFLQKYTPLTLWNYDVPVYNFIEPTSYYRERKDVEELVSMNYGNDWRLRGFNFFTYPKFEKDSLISSFDLEAMAGPIDAQNPFQFGSYFGGTETAIRFFQDGLEFKAVGFTLWDDPGTVNTNAVGAPLYNPKAYQIGSASTKLVLSFADDINITGTGEVADSNYNNDELVSSNSVTQETFNDTAVMGTAQLNLAGLHAQVKYLNVGSYFYSPGAQTNRWTPDATTPGYYTTDNYWEDEALIGYLNNFPFQGLQGVGEPTYAPYDRTMENILPYGDATPNRVGVFGTMTFDIGNHGWLKPQASYVFQASEFQPNYVVNSSGQEVAVDSTTNTAAARTFAGYEGALTLDFAKAFDITGHTFKISADYKYQSTNLGGDLPLFQVETYIGSLDFNPPIPGFDYLVLSCGYKYTQYVGGEYFLSGVGNPGTLASYSFFGDSSSVGSYNYLNLTSYISETSYAFGFMYPLSKTVEFRGDYFINQWNAPQFPAYTRWEDIWRFTYAAHF